MFKEREEVVRKVINVVRLAFCGAILGIAIAQGFLPAFGVSHLISGGVGFLAAGYASFRSA